MLKARHQARQEVLAFAVKQKTTHITFTFSSKGYTDKNSHNAEGIKGNKTSEIKLKSGFSM
jgi:hypothetical protein